LRGGEKIEESIGQSLQVMDTSGRPDKDGKASKGACLHLFQRTKKGKQGRRTYFVNVYLGSSWGKLKGERDEKSQLPPWGKVGKKKGDCILLHPESTSHTGGTQ